MQPGQLYVMDVDRENGQPLWWKNLIDGYSTGGYIVRFENYFYSYRNMTIDTDMSTDLWDVDDIRVAASKLRSNDRELVEDGKSYFSSWIKYFLSQIDGVVSNSEKIEIKSGELEISFDADVSDNGADNIKTIKKRYNIGSLVKNIGSLVK